MSDTPSAAERIGEMAAAALDALDGGELIGAVLMLAAFNPEDATEFKSMWFTPDGQVWPMTLGIVEDWRMGAVRVVARQGTSVVLRLEQPVQPWR